MEEDAFAGHVGLARPGIDPRWHRLFVGFLGKASGPRVGLTRIARRTKQQAASYARHAHALAAQRIVMAEFHGAHGVVVSHLLRMRKALGSNPSVSICVFRVFHKFESAAR